MNPATNRHQRRSTSPPCWPALTLEEKASLLDGADFWHTKAVERLGIPGVMVTDGPHGLRKQAGGDHLGLSDSVPGDLLPARRRPRLVAGTPS